MQLNTLRPLMFKYQSAFIYSNSFVQNFMFSLWLAYSESGGILHSECQVQVRANLVSWWISDILCLSTLCLYCKHSGLYSCGKLNCILQNENTFCGQRLMELVCCQCSWVRCKSRLSDRSEVMVGLRNMRAIGRVWMRICVMCKVKCIMENVKS